MTKNSNNALHWTGVKLPTPPSELVRYAIKMKTYSQARKT